MGWGEVKMETWSPDQPSFDHVGFVGGVIIENKVDIQIGGNRCFDKLRAALLPALRHFWQDSSTVLSLVGRPWLHDQAKASAKI